MFKKKESKKNKTLGDYISCGRHEFLAFVHDSLSAQSSNYRTIGNDLGKTYFGVLVCDRELEPERNEQGNEVKFFYKDKPIYPGDSDISYRDFGYDAEVLSEVPLSLSTSTYSGDHFKKRSKEFREAKKLLKKYGIY